MNKIRDPTSSSHWPEDIHREHKLREPTNTNAPIRQCRFTVFYIATVASAPADILPCLSLCFARLHAALSLV